MDEYLTSKMDVDVIVFHVTLFGDKKCAIERLKLKMTSKSYFRINATA